jgi:threonine dehydratase
MMIDVEKEVLRAEQRIRPHIRTTPLDYSFYFSQIGDCNLFFKLENLQHTGSFKARGAINKLLSLTPEQQAKGIVTASTGNHGAATAFGLHKLKANGLIFVPENASPTKVKAIRELGAEMRMYGLDGGVTEIYARDYAEKNGLVYISPYNDPQVVGGQGTIGIELTRQLDQIDVVLVALGGGGLISGIAGYLKSMSDKVTIIGCSPKNSAVMYESVKANEILDLESKPTLSDGTAGGVEPGAITFDLCRTLIDDYVLVSEDEIEEAMRLFMENQHMMIEGAAGVAIAAYLKMKDQFKGKNVVVVICGANISLKTLATILPEGKR